MRRGQAKGGATAVLGRAGVGRRWRRAFGRTLKFSFRFKREGKGEQVLIVLEIYVPSFF